jgi:hypothetical protein
MPIIMRDAENDFDAYRLAAAFDLCGIRVVSIVPPPPPRERWLVFGQAETIDFDAVDDRYGDILEGKIGP